MLSGEFATWPDQPDEIPEMHFPSSDEGAGESAIQKWSATSPLPPSPPPPSGNEIFPNRAQRGLLPGAVFRISVLFLFSQCCSLNAYIVPYLTFSYDLSFSSLFSHLPFFSSLYHIFLLKCHSIASPLLPNTIYRTV